MVSRRSFLTAAGAVNASAAPSSCSHLATCATAPGVPLPVESVNNSGHGSVHGGDGTADHLWQFA